MRITLLLTGKTKERYLQEGVNEYYKRIERYVPFTPVVLPDQKVSGKSSGEIVKIREGEQILQRLKPADHVVLLDEKGIHCSSEEFAAYLSGLEGRTGHTVFVVGGAYGFSEEVIERSNYKLSLSHMTFSHQMVRLIFTEQLYRAYTILKGEPYHHK